MGNEASSGPSHRGISQQLQQLQQPQPPPPSSQQQLESQSASVELRPTPPQPEPHALRAVLPFLAHSGYLSLGCYVHLHTVLRVSWRLEDALIHSSPSAFGPRRFRLWTLFLRFDPNCGSAHKTSSSASAQYNSHAVTMSAAATKLEGESTVQYYQRLAEADTDATSMSSGQVGEIVRDVVRTFPGHPFFRPGRAGERMLGRILQAVSAAYPAIGYCQGMNFVAGTMLLGRLPISHTGGLPCAFADPGSPESASADAPGLVPLDDAERLAAEVDCFSLLLSLMHKGSKLAMLGLWQTGVPKMKLRVYQLDRLLRWTLPKLHAHFEEIQLAPEILVAQWFITLFSYTVPLALTVRIWDYLFLGGWPAMYRVALALMSALEPQMLDLDLEGIGLMMRDWKKGAGSRVQAALARDFGPEKILLMAQSMGATPEVLQRLHENFALEMIAMCEASSGNGSASDGEGSPRDGMSSSGGVRSENESLMSSTMSGMLQSAAVGLGITSGQAAGERRGSSSGGGGGSFNKSAGALGADHTQWLSRYGEEFGPETVIDVLRVRDELRALETQTDADKQSIQARILRACEGCRAAEAELREAREQHAASSEARDMLLALLDAVTQAAARVRSDLDLAVDVPSSPMPAGGSSPRLGSPAVASAAAAKGESAVDVEGEDEDEEDEDEDSSSSETSAEDARGADEFPWRRSRGRQGGGDKATLGDSQSPTSPGGQTQAQGDVELVHFPPMPVQLQSLMPQLGRLPDTSGGESESQRALAGPAPLAAPRPSPFGAALKALGSKIKSIGKGIRRAGRRVAARRHGANSALKGDEFGSDEFGVGTTARAATTATMAAAAAAGFDDAEPVDAGSPPSLHHIEQQSQLCQRRLIAIQRKLAQATQLEDEAQRRVAAAAVELEEAREHKRSLCDQLQLVVEESNRMRAQKLADVAERHSLGAV